MSYKQPEPHQISKTIDNDPHHHTYNTGNLPYEVQYSSQIPERTESSSGSSLNQKSTNLPLSIRSVDDSGSIKREVRGATDYFRQTASKYLDYFNSKFINSSSSLDTNGTQSSYVTIQTNQSQSNKMDNYPYAYPGPSCSHFHY